MSERTPRVFSRAADAAVRLDWSVRENLARRFATTPPGGGVIDPDVARACAARLAR